MSSLRLPFTPRITPFRAVLLLGLVVGGAALAVAAILSLKVLIPLASECLQACASNPTLMAVARASASLCVALVGAGLLAGLVVLAGQLVATRRLVRQVESRAVSPPRRLARAASELGMADRLTYVVDPAPYAFCYGFRSLRVCISSGMVEALSGPELRAVLLHEGFHVHHSDPLRVLASRFVAGTLFLLPVAADLRDRYLVEKELAADAHVVAEMSPRPLAGALLKIYRSGNRWPVAALAAASVGPFSVIGERIRHLARPGEGPVRLRGGRVVASLAAVVLVLLATVGSTFAAEGSLPPGPGCCASVSLCDPAAGDRVGQR